jgi:hypothetical protein
MIQTFRIQIVAVLGSLILLWWVVYLIRGGKLKERYALLWFLAAAVVLVFSLWRDLLEILSRFFGIDYAPSLLFLMFLMFGVLLFMHFSIVASAHSKKITRLTQELSFLRRELARRDGKEEPGPPRDG